MWPPALLRQVTGVLKAQCLHNVGMAQILAESTMKIGGTLGLKIQKLWNNMDLPFTLQKWWFIQLFFLKHGRTMVEW